MHGYIVAPHEKESTIFDRTEHHRMTALDVVRAVSYQPQLTEHSPCCFTGQNHAMTAYDAAEFIVMHLIQVHIKSSGQVHLSPAICAEIYASVFAYIFSCIFAAFLYFGNKTMCNALTFCGCSPAPICSQHFCQNRCIWHSRNLYTLCRVAD